MLDAEALFLVDDHQPEVAEADVLGEDTVGADEHIDLAAFDVLKDLFLLFRGAEAAEYFNARRGVRHAFGEGVVVLFGEDSRGH